MAITSYGVKGAIGEALSAITPKSNMLASLAYVFSSQLAPGQQESLDFLGAVPALQEWLEKRQSAGLTNYQQKMLIQKFESSIKIPLDWVDNDKSDLVGDRISDLATRRMNLHGKLIADLLNNGATDTAFDGKAFFADDHAWGASGAIDNNISVAAATGTAPTPQEAAGAILTAWAQMLGFKDDHGEPVNENLTRLMVVCGTGYAAAHQQAITQNRLDTGSGTVDNPVMGLMAQGIEIGLIATPRFTGTTTMAVINASPGAKPFVIGSNMNAERVTAKAEGSDYEHDQDAWEFGLKAVEGATYGRFTDAVLVTYT